MLCVVPISFDFLSNIKRNFHSDSKIMCLWRIKCHHCSKASLFHRCWEKWAVLIFDWVLKKNSVPKEFFVRLISSLEMEAKDSISKDISSSTETDGTVRKKMRSNLPPKNTNEQTVLIELGNLISLMFEIMNECWKIAARLAKAEKSRTLVSELVKSPIVVMFE